MSKYVTNLNRKASPKRRLSPRKPNQPASCIGRKLRVAPGRNVTWYSEDGYPSLHIVSETDGSLTLFATYLGDHHRKLSAAEAYAEIEHRIVFSD
jgi:hypothetical protein